MPDLPIDRVFRGIAVKYLSAVDAEPTASHQHEIGGLPSAGFADLFGRPEGGRKLPINCRLVFLDDEMDSPVIVDDLATWYDARWTNPNRAPEYRLY